MGRDHEGQAMKVWHSDIHGQHNAASRREDPTNMECPERVYIIIEELQSRGLLETCPIKRHAHALLLTAHDESYLRFLEHAHHDWRKQGHAAELIAPYSSGSDRGEVPKDLAEQLIHYTLSAETAIGEHTYTAAKEAADMALTGITAVMQEMGQGFALCRPPGHHAPRDQLGGFCYMNNVCIAAYHALTLGAERVAVLDIDYHHGNGSQSILEAEPRIFFASLHADTRYAYPYILGKGDETGIGKAEGTMRNYPMPSGTADDVWRDALRAALLRVHDYDPDILLVSLGVDTYVGDPISTFRLESEDYLFYGEMLGKLKRPTLFVMEGGYNLDYIGVNVANVLEGFMQSRA